MTYAADTSVPVDRSRAEIERVLVRYGARSFAVGWDPCRAVLAFEIGERQIRFILPLPDRNAEEIVYTPTTRKRRAPGDQERLYQQQIRQRWRALLLIIKAKLEAVEAGVVTLESEFLPHVVLPSGETVAEAARPMVAEMYRTGRVLPVLPGLEERPALRAGE